VLAALVAGVRVQRLHQHVAVEDVVAHGRERLVGVPGPGRGIGRLLQEGLDPVTVRTNPDDAERGGRFPRYRDPRHRDAGAEAEVSLDHLRRIHPVDVVGAEHRHQVRLLAADEVQRLVDRVGRAGLPARAEPLLRRDRRHVVAQQAVQPPGGGDVPVQAVALVLGEHADLPDARVDQVGQREVDQPVEPAERHRRLGPVIGQRRQPPPRRPREHQAENALAGHHHPLGLP
jgi:hypothetical protein